MHKNINEIKKLETHHALHHQNGPEAQGGRSSDPACSCHGPEVGRQGHPKLVSGAPGGHLDLPTLLPKTAMIPIGNKRGQLTPNGHDID